MKKTLITAAILILSSSAFAQYVGPSTAAPTTTVQQLLKSGQDNQHATVEGTIVRHLKGDHYLFTDKTGQINIEIKKKYMPVTKIDNKTRLSLTGKLDKDWNEPIELEVKEVRILP